MPTVNGPDEITDLEAGNDKVFYSDSSGNVTEVALGVAATVLTSAGATSAPTFSALPADPTVGANKTMYTNNSDVESGVAFGAAGTVLTSGGTDATATPPTWEVAATGGQVTLNVATGKSVTAGEAVVIDASGTVAPVTLSATFDLTGTEYTPANSRSSWYTTGWELVYAEYDEIYWLFYQSSSNQLQAMPLSVSATGTVTLAGAVTNIATSMMMVYQVAIAQGDATYDTVYYLTAATTSGYSSHLGGRLSGTTATAVFNNIRYYTTFGGYVRAGIIGTQQGGASLDVVTVFGHYAQSYGYGGWWKTDELNSSGSHISGGSFYNIPSSPVSGTYFDGPEVVFDPNNAGAGATFQVVYRNDTGTGIEAVSIRTNNLAGYAGSPIQIDTQGLHSSGMRLLYIDTVGGSRFVVTDRKGWDGSSSSSANEWAVAYCFTKTSANQDGFTIGNSIQCLIGSASAGTYTATVAQATPSLAWDAATSSLYLLTRENSTGSPNGVAQGSYFTAAEFTSSATLALIAGAGPASTQQILLAGSQQIPMAMVWEASKGYALFRYGTSTSTGSYFMRSVKFAQSSDNENFIGIAQSAVSAGNPVDVKHIGSIDENQTGLTVGGRYYVQVNGALSTGVTTVPAGNAISATKLLLRDNL